MPLYLNLFLNQNEPEGRNSPLRQIIFDSSKQEIGNPGSNLKKFVKKYKENYKVHASFIADRT